MSHTVEKIGGTSMSQYAAVRDNVIVGQREADELYNRVFVVSAYGGMTDKLLEAKKGGKPGVYALFAGSENEGEWREALAEVREAMLAINETLFESGALLQQANAYIEERISEAERCLNDLDRLCQHGHFELEGQLLTVREMLASLGEAHSAWNMTHLLQRDGIAARMVDLSGWRADSALPLDEHIQEAFNDVDLSKELAIVTGYAHCEEGLMATFDRGYSEMTFSRIAVITKAREAVIHKEYHLSSADPRVVDEEKVVPIGRTNYDVADQLANLGMEAIHPRAAKGLRQNDIPLRVKNTFEPEHSGTLITRDYVSDSPCVEIIAGKQVVYAVELFDQEMVGDVHSYDQGFLALVKKLKAKIITKDLNANTITMYLGTNLKTVKRIIRELESAYPKAELTYRKVAIVSAIGSDMQVPGMLAKTVSALAESNISVLAMHQSMRQVDMQFVINEDDYNKAIQSLHRCLVEPHNHGLAICAA
ncbi:aspartate kinase [Litorivivens lipolytica]|uniref:aspartate kinase n=1 Tax=Litorivivens lipolytica TaxID=1524264 RepID=A0A7W4W779_9GAMM|nr:aspartate kinase [Litorivivens lipolytica]MBB3048791.1 aspartate kinase [Litorivivens lipolytica]